jgi:FKBP-type peptidyl-prolyl cis-trans isomerase FkpA
MKITIRKTLVPLLVALGMANTSDAQVGGKKMKDGYTVLPSGLEYKMVKKGKGARKAKEGDHAEMFIHVFLDDSVIFDSRKMYNPTKPVPVTITNPKANGDLMEGFMLLAEGDTALFRVPVDSMVKAGAPAMPGMKQGQNQKMRYEVQVVTIRTEEEDKKYNEEMGARQVGVDDKLLQDFFKKKGIKPTKTASGLYYTVEKEGTGAKAEAGKTLKVNYTGKLLEGETFDSNTDPAFKHPEPFSVVIGKGQVIKGWDEGMVLFNKGTKATLYIPSGLAYGSQDRSPHIPANSILVFEVEILDIADAPKAPAQVDPAQQAKVDDQMLQEYFTKNDIKATKTASGLYYAVSQKGMGPVAAPGKKVTMNYTGRTMDGKSFDSNIDPKFNHVSPFAFTLGVGQVIKGWDEGIQLMNLGTKGVLYIPSGLAYGAQSPTPAIPPNSVLIFDVEVVGID